MIQDRLEAVKGLPSRAINKMSILQPAAKKSATQLTRERVSILIVSLTVIGTLLYTSFHNLNFPPAPKTHTLHHFDQFSEARARQFVSKLEGLGPKLVGTGANEVGAVSLIVSSFINSPINDVAAWDYTGGFSTPVWMYSGAYGEENNIHNRSSSFGCVCLNNPRQQVDDDSIIVQRVFDTSLLCAPKSNVLMALNIENDDDDVTAFWIEKLRQHLHIDDLKGCESIASWMSADILLRYFTAAYSLDLPTSNTYYSTTLMQVVEVSEVIKNIIAGNIASAEHLSKFLPSSYRICESPESIEACTLGGSSSGALYSFERLVLTNGSPHQMSAITFLDISLSHNYIGHFVLDLPNCGALSNVYQNMTNIAFKLTPLNLMMAEGLIDDGGGIDGLDADIKQSRNEAMRELNAMESLDFYTLSQYLSSKRRDLRVHTPGFTRKHPMPAFILASHYDTAPSSPGGADAGTGVGIILEVLTNMLHRPQMDLKRPLMIILNGGEENILSAAHGFIMRHPWIEEGLEILNLEAAGNAGKEYLLRTGSRSRYLIEMYKKLVHQPQALSLSHEAFEGGLVPGLTDFQLYRDLSKFEGFDLAFGSGGYYYHTSMDSLENTQNGSLQHYGDTVFALTNAILTTPVAIEFKDTLPKDIRNFKERESSIERNVYFDVYGKMLVLLPVHILDSKWTLVSMIVTCVLLPSLNCNQRSKRVYSLMRYILLMSISIGANVSFAYILHSIGLGFRWFSHPIFIPILYTPIFIAVFFEGNCYLVSLRKRTTENNLISSWQLENDHFIIACEVWVICYLIGWYYKSQIIYIPLILYVTALVGRLGGYGLSSLLKRQSTSLCVTLTTLFGHVLGLLFCISLYTSFIDHLGPVFGRIVLPQHPDVIMATLTSLLLLILLTPLTFLCPFSRIAYDTAATKFCRKLLWLVYVPVCVSFVLSHKPFTNRTPQRVDAVHFMTRLYDGKKVLRAETGVSIQGGDAMPLSHQLLEHYKNELEKYWRPIFGNGLSSPTSFYDDPLSTKSSSTIGKFRRFTLTNDPSQMFLRYPQGALFRRFGSKTIEIYPDLIPPFYDPESSDLNLFNAPVKNASDLSWQLLEPFVMMPNNSVPYSPRHQPPQLKWKIQLVDSTLKRIHLTLTGGYRMIISVLAEPGIVGWSLSHSLLEVRSECNCYGIIFGGGVAAPTGFSFWVDVDPSILNVFTIAVSSNYFSILTPPLLSILDMEKQLQMNGIFVTTTTSVGELGHWRIKIGTVEIDEQQD